MLFKLYNFVYNLLNNSRSYYTDSAMWRIYNNKNIVEMVVLDSPMTTPLVKYNKNSRNYKNHFNRVNRLATLFPTNRKALKINPLNP